MNSIANRFEYMKEWVYTHWYTQRLVWFRKQSGRKRWRRVLKRQDFWLDDQNFGDYLSRVVVAATAGRLGVGKFRRKQEARKMLAIGSILHFARDGDVVWGSGVNGKVDPGKHRFTMLDVRMVRGPLTRKFLIERGIPVAPVYGDPALLLPYLLPHCQWTPTPGKIIVIPNLNDLPYCNDRIPVTMSLVTPLLHWKFLLREILTSELVITSSLHGIVVSEAFGVPVRFVMPVGGETLFKYKDYFEGTGRVLKVPPDSIIDKLIPESGVSMPSPVYDSDAMLKAFPVDFF
jgi:pyruvyltransferase